MGWERKRGKLHELNRLLRGATDTTFVAIDGQRRVVPADVRYVITLDADTRLPRDTVRRLIGKMAHPLNRPRFDADAGRVVEGYAMLQPRVTPSLPVGREGSLFQRIFSSVERHRPLCRRRLRRLPGSVRRRLLCRQGHLRRRRFRGRARRSRARTRRCSATICSRASSRAPASSPISRSSRNFPPATTSPRAPASLGARRLAVAALDLRPRPAISAGRKRRIPPIGRWKMLDNLRRTLSAPAAVARLARRLDAAASRQRAIWTVFILATIVLPTLLPVVAAAIVPRRSGITLRSHLRRARRRSAARARPVGAHDQLPGASGLADGRRDRTDPVPAVRHAAGICSNGSRRRRPAIGPRLDLVGFYRQMAGAVVIGRCRR